MKNNRILAIIKELTGESSPGEAAEIRQWKEKSPENKAFSESVEKTWEWSGQYDKTINPDVEKGLKRLQQRIAADRRQAKGAPKSSPAKTRRMLPRLILRLAAVAVILVTFGFLAKNFLTPPATPFVVQTTSGEQERIALTDGSIVWLNENSQLTFNNPNDKQLRKARLSGEAFFEVAKNPSKPFIIETANNEVEVVGTAFNVRALPGEDFTEVQVQSGKVAFKTKTGNQQVFLNANEKGLSFHESSKIITEKDESLNALAWKTKSLHFQNTPLQKVISDLERYYQISLTLSNKDLKTCEFTSPFVDSELDVVLQTITIAFGMQLEKENPNTYLLNGGTCR